MYAEYTERRAERVVTHIILTEVKYEIICINMLLKH